MAPGGMKYLIIGIAFSIMSNFVGCLLPFVSLRSNAKAPTNVFWGFIYGLVCGGTVERSKKSWGAIFRS